MARKFLALFLSLFILIPAGCAGLPLSTSPEVEISFSSGLVPLASDSGTLPTSYTLTATVNPAGTALDWSVEWVNPSASWANGKSAGSYVKVTPQTDGSNVATVRLLNPFGAQIKVVCSARNVPEKKAECLVDYARRMTGAGLKMYGIQHIDGDTLTETPVFEIPIDKDTATLTPASWAGYDDIFCVTDISTVDSSVFTVDGLGAVKVYMTWFPLFDRFTCDTWGVALPELRQDIRGNAFNIHKNAIMGTLGMEILNMVMTDEKKLSQMVEYLSANPAYTFVFINEGEYMTTTIEKYVYLDYKALM